MRKLQCTIYGYLNGEEKEQVLEIEYDYIFCPGGWLVSRLNILTTLQIEPSDLYEDVHSAIVNDFKTDWRSVYIEDDIADKLWNMIHRRRDSRHAKQYDFK